MNALPRWYHSRKGMVPMFGKTLPAGFDELARIVVVALFFTANREKKK